MCAMIVIAPALTAHGADAPRQYRQTRDEARQLLGQGDRLVALWRDFADAHAEHALGDVGRLHQALWTLHQAEGEGTAEQVNAAVLALLAWPEPTDEGRLGTALYEHAHRAAMELRARVEMRALAARLQDYYRRHVEYPPSLEALVEAELASREQLVDPFGQPYRYEARPRPIMPDIPRQTYTLRCDAIEADHRAMSALLERLDGEVDTIEISTLVPDEGQAYVRERRDDGSWSSARRWDVGRDRGGVRLWAVYDDYLLVGEQQIPRIVQADR